METFTRILLESLFERNSFLKNATVPRSVRDTMLTCARRLMASTGWQPWSGMLGLLDEDGNVNLFPESGGILCATQAASRPLYNIWKKAIS